MLIGDICKNFWTFGSLSHLPLRSACYPTLPLKAAPLFSQGTPVLQGGTFHPCNSLSGLRDGRTPSWGVPVQQTLSWTAVQNWFLGLLKLWQTSKLCNSQDFPHLLLKTGNIIGLPSFLVLLHFPKEEGVPLSVSWLFLTLFPLRTPRWTPSGCGDLLHLSFSSYSTTSSLETSICIKATLIFFAKCLWHRNFYMTLSSRHDARDSFNSSVSLLHSSPDPLYTDLWGSLGRLGA